MPRKRNQKTIESILNTSMEAFCQKGYDNASYADIAKASGINRATVQHYFPKKELMASMNLERLRAACDDVVKEKWSDIEDSLVRQYLVGQIYVSALMANEGIRRFICGVLENRAFTDATIATDLDWSVEQVLGHDGPGVDDELRQDVVASMNGLYGLMYHCAHTGEDFDIAKRLRPGLVSLGRLAGRSIESCNELFDRYSLELNELKKLGTELFSRAFVKTN